MIWRNGPIAALAACVRIKICRKEAKESRFFLRLIDTAENGQAEREQQALIQESQELTNIFGAIFRKSE